MIEIRLFVRQPGENRDFQTLADPGVFRGLVERIKSTMPDGLRFVESDEVDCTLLFVIVRTPTFVDSVNYTSWIDDLEEDLLAGFGHWLFVTGPVSNLKQQIEFTIKEEANKRRRDDVERAMVGHETGTFWFQLAACMEAEAKPSETKPQNSQ